MHDTIHRLAAEFSQQAWALLSSKELTMSNSEHVRFLRAFYRYELLCLLVQAIPRSNEYMPGTPQGPKKDLLARHAPWEYEQIVCAYEFLEEKFGDAIREVLAHDVDFGEYSINYLSRGPDAPWTQQWLSKGLQFIDHFMRNPSYGDKCDLLHDEVESGSRSETTPWDQLCLENNDDTEQDDGTRLEDFSAAARELLDPRPHRPDDVDDGPKEVWFQQHEILPRTAFVMFAENSGYRDRAYVFWNKTRLQWCGVLGRPHEIPAREEVSVRGEEWEVMQRSWGERSKVWQKGGSGYWKNGDLSGIEWPQWFEEGSTDVDS